MNRTMSLMHRRLAVVATVCLAFGALSLGSAEQSESIAPRTKSYPTLTECQAGMRMYQSSWTKITKSCTYAGGWFFGWKTASGPYYFTYTTL